MKPKRLVNRKLLREIKKKPCLVCLCPPGPFKLVDPSHLRSKGAGGPDTDWNVVPMCRECHRTWHDWGPVRFLSHYREFCLKLVRMGWEVNLETGKLFHPEMREI